MSHSSQSDMEPLNIRPVIPKREALLLRSMLEDAVTGYAPSNPRSTLLARIEVAIALRWPQEARDVDLVDGEKEA